MNYCNGCKKNLELSQFTLKNNKKDHYSRCNSCRQEHNERNKKAYVKTIDNKFASFEGLTTLGKRKVDCWNKELNNIDIGCVKTTNNKDKYWFNCDNCNHNFDVTPNKVTQGRWCPYCAGSKLCENEECMICFNRSFASFDGKTKNGNLKVDCWSRNNSINPRMVTKGSGVKVLFKCDACPHEFESRLSGVSSNHKTKGQKWCPYCSEITCKLCDDNDCSHCFNRSFASFKAETTNGKLKVDCWSDLNQEKPRNITLHNHKKYIFNCDHCFNEFESSLNHVFNNRWCPVCKESTGEKFIHKELEKTGYEVKRQVKFDECKNVNKLPYDFGILNQLPLDVLVEFDGGQHFKTVKYFGGIDNRKKGIKRDIIKNKYSLENNKVLVRISFKEKDFAENFIQQGIQRAINNKPGIIYSNYKLYKKAYIASMV